MSYEFLEYLFKFSVEETDTVSNEGQNKDHDVAQHMTVYVKTISEYLFKFTNEENSTVSNVGHSKDRGGVPYMTVYVKTVNGKTIGIKTSYKQSNFRIKDEVERQTKIPTDHQHIVSQGKVLSEKKTIEKSNIKEEATLVMTMRLQGGAKDEELMTSAGRMDERQVKRRTSEPYSETSGVEEVKLSEVTDHIEREIYSATKMMQKEISSVSKRSDEWTEEMMQSFQSNTMERMEMMMRQSNEMMLQ